MYNTSRGDHQFYLDTVSPSSPRDRMGSGRRSSCRLILLTFVVIAALCSQIYLPRYAAASSVPLPSALGIDADDADLSLPYPPFICTDHKGGVAEADNNELLTNYLGFYAVGDLGGGGGSCGFGTGANIRVRPNLWLVKAFANRANKTASSSPSSSPAPPPPPLRHVFSSSPALMTDRFEYINIHVLNMSSDASSSAATSTNLQLHIDDSYIDPPAANSNASSRAGGAGSGSGVGDDINNRPFAFHILVKGCALDRIGDGLGAGQKGLIVLNEELPRGSVVEIIASRFNWAGDAASAVGKGLLFFSSSFAVQETQIRIIDNTVTMDNTAHSVVRSHYTVTVFDDDSFILVERCSVDFTVSNAAETYMPAVFNFASFGDWSLRNHSFFNLTNNSVSVTLTAATTISRFHVLSLTTEVTAPPYRSAMGFSGVIWRGNRVAIDGVPGGGVSLAGTVAVIGGIRLSTIVFLSHSFVAIEDNRETYALRFSSSNPYVSYIGVGRWSTSAVTLEFQTALNTDDALLRPAHLRIRRNTVTISTFGTPTPIRFLGMDASDVRLTYTDVAYLPDPRARADGTSSTLPFPFANFSRFTTASRSNLSRDELFSLSSMADYSTVNYTDEFVGVSSSSTSAGVLPPTAAENSRRGYTLPMPRNAMFIIAYNNFTAAYQTPNNGDIITQAENGHLVGTSGAVNLRSGAMLIVRENAVTVSTTRVGMLKISHFVDVGAINVVDASTRDASELVLMGRNGDSVLILEDGSAEVLGFGGLRVEHNYLQGIIWLDAFTQSSLFIANDGGVATARPTSAATSMMGLNSTPPIVFCNNSANVSAVLSPSGPVMFDPIALYNPYVSNASTGGRLRLPQAMAALCRYDTLKEVPPAMTTTSGVPTTTTTTVPMTTTTQLPTTPTPLPTTAPSPPLRRVISLGACDLLGAFYTRSTMGSDYLSPITTATKIMGGGDYGASGSSSSSTSNGLCGRVPYGVWNDAARAQVMAGSTSATTSGGGGGYTLTAEGASRGSLTLWIGVNAATASRIERDTVGAYGLALLRAMPNVAAVDDEGGSSDEAGHAVDDVVSRDVIASAVSASGAIDGPSWRLFTPSSASPTASFIEVKATSAALSGTLNGLYSPRTLQVRLNMSLLLDSATRPPALSAAVQQQQQSSNDNAVPIYEYTDWPMVTVSYILEPPTVSVASTGQSAVSIVSGVTLPSAATQQAVLQAVVRIIRCENSPCEMSLLSHPLQFRIGIMGGASEWRRRVRDRVVSDLDDASANHSSSAVNNSAVSSYNSSSDGVYTDDDGGDDDESLYYEDDEPYTLEGDCLSAYRGAVISNAFVIVPLSAAFWVIVAWCIYVGRALIVAVAGEAVVPTSKKGPAKDNAEEENKQRHIARRVRALSQMAGAATPPSNDRKGRRRRCFLARHWDGVVEILYEYLCWPGVLAVLPMIVAEGQAVATIVLLRSYMGVVFAGDVDGDGMDGGGDDGSSTSGTTTTVINYTFPNGTWFLEVLANGLSSNGTHNSSAPASYSSDYYTAAAPHDGRSEQQRVADLALGIVGLASLVGALVLWLVALRPLMLPYGSMVLAPHHVAEVGGGAGAGAGAGGGPNNDQRDVGGSSSSPSPTEVPLLVMRGGGGGGDHNTAVSHSPSSSGNCPNNTNTPAKRTVVGNIIYISRRLIEPSHEWQESERTIERNELLWRQSQLAKKQKYAAARAQSSATMLTAGGSQQSGATTNPQRRRRRRQRSSSSIGGQCGGSGAEMGAMNADADDDATDGASCIIINSTATINGGGDGEEEEGSPRGAILRKKKPAKRSAELTSAFTFVTGSDACTTGAGGSGAGGSGEGGVPRNSDGGALRPRGSDGGGISGAGDGRSSPPSSGEGLVALLAAEYLAVRACRPRSIVSFFDGSTAAEERYVVDRYKAMRRHQHNPTMAGDEAEEGLATTSSAAENDIHHHTHPLHEAAPMMMMEVDLQHFWAAHMTADCDDGDGGGLEMMEDYSYTLAGDARAEGVGGGDLTSCAFTNLHSMPQRSNAFPSPQSPSSPSPPPPRRRPISLLSSHASGSCASAASSLLLASLMSEDGEGEGEGGEEPPLHPLDTRLRRLSHMVGEVRWIPYECFSFAIACGIGFIEGSDSSSTSACRTQATFMVLLVSLHSVVTVGYLMALIPVEMVFLLLCAVFSEIMAIVGTIAVFTYEPASAVKLIQFVQDANDAAAWTMVVGIVLSIVLSIFGAVVDRWERWILERRVTAALLAFATAEHEAMLMNKRGGALSAPASPSSHGVGQSDDAYSDRDDDEDDGGGSERDYESDDSSL